MAVECCAGCAPGDAELEVMDEYLTLLCRGAEPEVEVFLQGHPEHAESLRPVLEAAVMLNHAWRRLKAKYPDVTVRKLLKL
jgi:hypothetical protein